METSMGELGLRLSPDTLPHVIWHLPRNTPSSLHPLTSPAYTVSCTHSLSPRPALPPAPGIQPLLPACVISFRDSLACLLLACFGLSPTPPAGCLLPCPPPECDSVG